MKTKILWQDNEAEDKLAKNRKMSCSRKSKHIGIQLFWADARVKQGKIRVNHCPTDKILAYFFTDNLQGSKLNLFRRVIMEWDDVLTLWDDSDDKDKVT